jgi:hypothetical protein
MLPPAAGQGGQPRHSPPASSSSGSRNVKPFKGEGG